MTRDEFVEKWNLRSMFINPLFLIDLQEVINHEKDEAIADHLRYQKGANYVFEKMMAKPDIVFYNTGELRILCDFNGRETLQQLWKTKKDEFEWRDVQKLKA